MAAKWKYQKKPTNFYKSNYLDLPRDKEVTIKLSDWNFTKKPIEGSTKTVFSSDVTEKDGEKTSKLWNVYEFDAVQILKKKLAGKKPPIKLKVVRHYDEEELENSFEIN